MILKNVELIPANQSKLLSSSYPTLNFPNSLNISLSLSLSRSNSLNQRCGSVLSLTGSDPEKTDLNDPTPSKNQNQIQSLMNPDSALTIHKNAIRTLLKNGSGSDNINRIRNIDFSFKNFIKFRGILIPVILLNPISLNQCFGSESWFVGSGTFFSRKL